MNPLRSLVQLFFARNDGPPEASDLVLLGEPDGEMVAGMWQGILEQRGIHSMIKNVSGIAYLHAGLPMFEVYVRFGDLQEARALLGLDAPPGDAH